VRFFQEWREGGIVNWEVKEGEMLPFIGSVLGVIVVVAFFLLQPYYEAKAFNACTHSNATYWDAVWADLRVTECKK
jgi:hypothetical protein